MSPFDQMYFLSDIVNLTLGFWLFTLVHESIHHIRVSETYALGFRLEAWLKSDELDDEYLITS